MRSLTTEIPYQSTWLDDPESTCWLTSSRIPERTGKSLVYFFNTYLAQCGKCTGRCIPQQVVCNADIQDSLDELRELGVVSHGKSARMTSGGNTTSLSDKCGVKGASEVIPIVKTQNRVRKRTLHFTSLSTSYYFPGIKP